MQNTQTPKKHPRTWAWIVVGLLTGHVALMATAVTLAVRGHGSAGITPDYYRKALSWDETRAIERENENLGWQVTATPEAWLNPQKRRTVRVTVHDRDGQPVEQARVQLDAYHRLDPAQTSAARARETGPGVYAAELPMTRTGEWRITVTAELGVERYERYFDQPVLDISQLKVAPDAKGDPK